MTAEKRTKQLIIRVSPTEFETLTRQKTHPNLARYIRERVLEDGKASDKKTVKFQFPPEVVRVLAGMGNNLNQIAKTLNTAAKVGTLGKGRNIRLKGALYEQDFRFGEDLRADITHRSRQHRAANESRLRHATAKYQRGIEAKRAENNRRYTRPAVTHEQGSIQALSVELARHIGNRFDSRRDIAHSDIELKQRIGRSETAESRSRAHTRPVEHQDQRFNTGKLPGREQQSNAGIRAISPKYWGLPYLKP